ncbi:hypothetical protein [Chromobacterium haemolyticum]|uniref:hypothetical protein n=1 Tax=Chromobacterium haemolyticum TaxID=394935 RepID=UPI0017461F71|nr:hypothetical protein [Chromobacterium haemolyticum]QOD81407.1 hypothetical protein IEZ30_15960 [Chromobacterium haemolyticum]
MKLSKEQKQELIDTLSHPWGRVRLQCDGYRVDLVVERSKGMSYRVVTYVNESWQGKWMSGKEEHPEQKFLRKSVRPLVSQKKRDELEKAVGKRYFKKMCAEDPFWTATLTGYCVTWASGKAVINHLCKVCDSIEILAEQAA